MSLKSKKNLLLFCSDESPHLGVVLVQVLPHIGHGGVGDLDGVAVDHLPNPQLVVWRKTGVEEGLELLSGVGWLGREG